MNATESMQSFHHGEQKFVSITPTLGGGASITEDWLHSLHCGQVSASDCTKVFQELCVSVTTTASRRHLRSAARGDLQVLETGTVIFFRTLPVLQNFGTVHHCHSETITFNNSADGLKLTCSVYPTDEDS